MQLDLFATGNDYEIIWNVLFATGQPVAFENASRPDQAIRRFDNASALVEAIGVEPEIPLAVWPSSVGGTPEIEYVAFRPDYAIKTGHFGRHHLRGLALIGFFRQSPQRDGCLSNCRLSWWSEAGARAQSVYRPASLAEVDWKQFASITNKIRRELTKVAPAKLGSALVLPCTFDALKQGRFALWGWGEEVTICSSRLTIKSR